MIFSSDADADAHISINLFLTIFFSQESELVTATVPVMTTGIPTVPALSVAPEEVSIQQHSSFQLYHDILDQLLSHECQKKDREERYSRRPDLPLPTKPPFTAHVGNLSFEASEDDISNFFAQCDISNVRLVRDRIGDRPKGFGYVEFHTLDGLKKALELNNGYIAGRNVRISVADPRKLLKLQ